MKPQTQNALSQLFNTTRTLFNSVSAGVAGFPGVLSGSFPILWFGDIDAYEVSERRIVTIGINPSDIEFFDKGNPVCRFGNAGNAFSSGNFIQYAAGMNGYFHNKPYRTWFSHYNSVLNILDTNYGGKFPSKVNTAVHLDFIPVATTAKWSGMGEIAKGSLLKTYSSSLQSLLRILDPGVILISVNKVLMSKQFGANADNCINKNTAKIGKNGYVRGYVLDGSASHITSDAYNEENLSETIAHKAPGKVLIWGKCNSLPFLMDSTAVSNEIKHIKHILSILQ